jgi:hypothetical protein
MNAKLPMTMFLVAGAACGRISGEIAARRPETVRQMAGATVFLVPATPKNAATLGNACAATRDWFDRYRDEHTRLASMRQAHLDSAKLVSHDGANAGERHVEVARSYEDSLRALRQAPSDEPDSVAIRLSAKSASVGADGDFSFGRSSPGNYYIVIPGLGWSGVTTTYWPVHVSLNLERLQPSCAVVGEG